MKWHYLQHLLVWTVPVLAGQWAIGWRVFGRNLAGIVFPPIIATLFFGACDSVAVRQRIWFFDPNQILGWHVGPLPAEEVLFFFLTSLLVSQSLILLLPARCRR